MGGIKKGIWIARDQNGMLYAYIVKPKMVINSITGEGIFGPSGGRYGYSVMSLPLSWYKNIKFENSPVFVSLTEDFVKQFIKN